VRSGCAPENEYVLEENFAPANITVLHFSGDNYASKLTIETIGSSEAILNFYQTIRRQIPEDSILHTRRPEILIYRICRYYNEHCDLMIQQQSTGTSRSES